MLLSTDAYHRTPWNKEQHEEEGMSTQGRCGSNGGLGEGEEWAIQGAGAEKENKTIAKLSPETDLCCG